MRHSTAFNKIRLSILVVFVLLCTNSLRSQVIVDRTNAPLNPTGPYSLYAQNYNTKDDVASIDYTLYDKNGKPIDDRITYDKEIAKQNKMIFHKVDNGFITEIVDYKRPEAIKTYQYSNGLITREENKFWIYNYKYDSQKRLIEKQAESKNGERSNYITTYSYKNLPEDKLQVNLKTEYDKDLKASTSIMIFKDGLVLKNIVSDNYTYSFDHKGNWIYKSWNSLGANEIYRYIIYYSDLEKIQKDGYLKWRIEYLRKTQIPIPFPLLNGRTIQNNKAISPQRVLDDGGLFYLPLSKEYYYGADAYSKDRPIGTTGMAKQISSGHEAILQTNGTGVLQIYQRTKITKGRSVFWGKSYFTYDTILKKGFYNKNYKTAEKTFLPTKVIEGDTYVYGVNPEKGKYAIYLNGLSLDASKLSLWKFTKEGDPIVMYDGKPVAILEGYFDIKETMLAVAKPYAGEQLFNSLKDVKGSSNSSISTNQTNKTPTNSSCIAGDCTNGYGTYVLKNGTRLIGFFKDGKAHGYTRFFYTNGDVFGGEYINGNRTGYGIYNWKETNEMYYGQYKDGKRHGYGYFYKGEELVQAGIYTEGKLTTDYTTEYLNKKSADKKCSGNCQNGFGSMLLDNGDYYIGFFKNGIQYKIGTYKWRNNGAIYYGEWNSQGNLSGSGMYVTDTFYYCGDFDDNGRITGLGVKTDRKTNKDIYGLFENGNLVKDYATNGTVIHTLLQDTSSKHNNTQNSYNSELQDKVMQAMAQSYVNTYHKKGKEAFKKMLVDYHNTIALLSTDSMLNEEHTTTFKLIYKIDKVVAHKYFLNLPDPYFRTNTSKILAGLTNDERTFIIEESKKMTRKYTLKDEYKPKN